MQWREVPQASPTTKSVLTRFSEAWLKVELVRLLRRREKKRRNKKGGRTRVCVRAAGNVTVGGGEIWILKTL